MSQFTCSSCGYGSASWYGKCPQCSEWNTFVKKEDSSPKKKSIQSIKITPLSKISTLDATRLPTTIHEFDRVLGGGLVRGEVVLLSGEPGVGKSTMLLSTLEKMKVLYISGEESGMQIRHRADRLNVDFSRFSFSEAVDIESVLSSINLVKQEYDVVVIDSIQTMYSLDIPSTAGSVAQVRQVTSQLVDFAKKNNIAIILVGHITKEGDIAGPKTMEHLVDCVLYLEGDKLSHFRILRALKNRFGPTDEVGVFEMGEKGLNQVKDPTAFLEDMSQQASGKAIVGVIEGSRVMFFEVQCLTVPTVLAVPRRVVSGVDYNKVQLILAVIRKNLRLPLDKFDVYVNVVGGVSIRSTAADLGVAASVVSSLKNLPVAKKSVFIGEISLLGEVRSVFGEAKLIKEAGRLGFRNVFSSKTLPSVVQIPTIFRNK